MDSKLLGSNIAWLSRYELIHETLRIFYKEVKETSAFDKATKEKLDMLLKTDGNKVVYICSSEEVKTRLQKLGELIYKILTMFPASVNLHYLVSARKFHINRKMVVRNRQGRGERNLKIWSLLL